MQSTDISQEIAALREQIAAAEAAIIRHKSRVSAREPGDARPEEDAELSELVEARDLMTARLSRLESCKRIPEA